MACFLTSFFKSIVFESNFETHEKSFFVSNKGVYQLKMVIKQEEFHTLTGTDFSYRYRLVVLNNIFYLYLTYPSELILCWGICA